MNELIIPKMITVCGWLLTAISWGLVLVTVPFSLCVVFKVSQKTIQNKKFLFSILSTWFQSDTYNYHQNYILKLFKVW